MKYNISNKESIMNICPICGTKVNEPKDNIEGDLIECSDCGTLLEIISLNPFEILLYEEPEK